MIPAPTAPSRADELRALRERVRAATGPDRELDAAICAALRYVGARERDVLWVARWTGPIEGRGERVVLLGATGECAWAKAPLLTASIDAALALAERALPKARLDRLSDRRRLTAAGDWHCRFTGAITDDANGFGLTAALAILDALLTALIAQAEGG